MAKKFVYVLSMYRGAWDVAVNDLHKWVAGADEMLSISGRTLEDVAGLKQIEHGDDNYSYERTLTDSEVIAAALKVFNEGAPQHEQMHAALTFEALLPTIEMLDIDDETIAEWKKLHG